MKKMIVLISATLVCAWAHAGQVRSADGRVSVHPEVQSGYNYPVYSLDFRDTIALPFCPDYTGYSRRISSDGSIISGQLYGFDENGDLMDMRAATWERTELIDNVPYYSGPCLLPSLGEGQFNAMFDMSCNGHYVVGHCILKQDSSISASYQAVYWDRNGDVYSLGTMFYNSIWYNSSIAHHVRDDGMIFGTTYNADGEGEILAFIWDKEHGMRYLKDVLERNYGYDFGTAILTSVEFLNPEGTIIYGNGFNSAGDIFHWQVTVPEPASVFLLAFGGVLLRRWKRTRCATADCGA